MSREEAIGLFGELWFLRRWLTPVGRSTIQMWQVTHRARHDFQSRTVSIEVKTAASQSITPPTHRIQSLEQLAAPEQGTLFLFSLQITEDALAANTLHSLVASLVIDLQSDAQAVAQFNEKLAARGYSPADQQAPAKSFRVLAERLYRVDDQFPKLTRSIFGNGGLPHGIGSVEYTLDLAVCADWLIAISPSDFTPL